MLLKANKQAAMEAAIESNHDDNESDAKAEAAGPVADKPGQPEDKDLPREAKENSLVNYAVKPTCPTTGSTPEIRVDQNRVCHNMTDHEQSDAQYKQRTNQGLKVSRSEPASVFNVAVNHTCPTARSARIRKRTSKS